MIFYWCSGQEDNIGDVILRRRMLRSLQDNGECRVYVGRASQSFIESLGLRANDGVYSNFLKFIISAMFHCFRRDWKFGFNPGEIKCNRRQSLMHAALIPMMLLSNLRGRRCIRVGVGVHDYTSRWDLFVRATVRLAAANIWRDEESCARFGQGTVAPDWAFDENGERQPMGGIAASRHMLGVSLRSDGSATTQTWVMAIHALARMHKLEPVVVVQVRRDSQRARNLAERLECGLVDWTSESHSEQEARLRSLYGECAGVVSDRLHVLVMAMTEGALPIGLMEHPDNKVRRHFQAAGFDRISWDVQDWTPEKIVGSGSEVLDNRVALMKQLAEAQNQIHQLDSMVKGL